jgi:photosystem II stability/assembly factor-like uncharacterized protein
MTTKHLSRSALLALALITPFAAGALPRVFAQPGRVDPNVFGGLRWRSIGPFRGGRVNGVTGVPGQPNTFYFGSVGGGVWKTTNAGRTWLPIFDSQPVASIGAIAVAPSNPNIVYVGTGESDMRSQISYGNGMYKSTDAGKTWTHLGLVDTRQIARVIVDPKNADVLFVAALGHAYGANPDRGVYRSRDGGATWQKVLFKGNDIGAVDVTFDPANTQTVYASLWNTRRPPWSIYPPSYGPGSGLHKSTDGGSTWQPLTRGLPTEAVGRIGIAVALSNSSRVYAIVDAKDGGLYRSDDAGATFAKVSSDARIWGRGWYFGKVVVDPKNPDLVYVSNTGVYRSRDGGKTFGEPFKGSPGGDDYHQLWIAPDDGNRMILGGDQGAVISVEGLNEHPTWSSWLNQATAQIYRVAADNSFPYWVTGAQQDSGAVRVRSRGRFAGITMRDWEPLCAGGESGYTAPDPLHPEIVFGGNTVTRCNVETGKTENVSPEVDLPTPARHTWTVPLVFSPADQHALYFSDQYLFKTTDGGSHWTRISEDMTRENPGVPPNLDAATAADVPEQSKRLGVIYTIAPSAVKAPLLWIGTDDGYVHVTQDDGKTWANVTPPGVTAWSKVVMIEASHVDANEAYAALDRHRLEDYDPYIYRTRDAGKTWQKITTGLPPGVYMQTIKEDPKRRGLLVAGTELGVFVSLNDGDTWQSLQLNLPPCSMRDFAFHDNDLIVATHGRGFWVLDDISALRQSADAATADAHLFKPADAFILPPNTDDGTPTQKDEPEAENPPNGAIIDYYLKTAATGPVTLEILNAGGATVRRFASTDPVPTPDPNTLAVNAIWQRAQDPPSAAAGMHRFVWDLRPEPPAGGRGRGGRGGGGGGGGGRGGLPPVAAGGYSVKLTVNGKTFTQPLVVKRDPRER